MLPELRKRSLLVALAAFVARAFARSYGSAKPLRFGVDIKERARRYLSKLNTSEESLTFKIALENLRRECDLLMEEAALVPEGLELQRKVVALADRYEIAQELLREALNEPPVVKLFHAILAQAREAGSNQVQIDFEANPIAVLTRAEGSWKEPMRIPSTLEEPLRGVIARVEGIGFGALARHIEGGAKLPREVTLKWIAPNRLEVVCEF